MSSLRTFFELIIWLIKVKNVSHNFYYVKYPLSQHTKNIWVVSSNTNSVFRLNILGLLDCLPQRVIPRSKAKNHPHQSNAFFTLLLGTCKTYSSIFCNYCLSLILIFSKNFIGNDYKKWASKGVWGMEDSPIIKTPNCRRLYHCLTERSGIK